MRTTVVVNWQSSAGDVEVSCVCERARERVCVCMRFDERDNERIENEDETNVSLK